MNKLKKYWFLFCHNLNLTTQLSSEERLALLIEEQRHVNFLADIRAIRTNGAYTPDYNKAPVHQDYHLSLNNHEINCRPRLSSNRPVEFESLDIWLKEIRKEIKEMQTQPGKQQRFLF